MDSVTHIFVDENSQVRIGWRIGIFLFAYFLFSIFTAVISLTMFGNAPLGMGLTMSIGSLVVLIPAIVVGSLCGKLLENLPWSGIGVPITRKAATNLVLGCFVGITTFAFAVLIAFIGGGLSFTLNAEVFNNAVYHLVWPLLVFGVAAAFEEAFFRGYIFQTLTRSGYAWLAIFITAVPFGVVHLWNPNAGVISSINTILAGVWFGLAYLKTRDLWFVWGVHWFWNWTQGSVFGIEVSGLTDLSAGSLLVEKDLGPHWLTGTSYGIEGGIACTIAILASIVAIQYGKFATDNTDNTDETDMN